MDKEQQFEWDEAQKIVIGQDLIDAAKRHLQFLATVDRNRGLYEGPILQRAIYRYNACWLPLLAKHTESQISKGPLVVPLDCEWVWHCHRLNPVQYKTDCEQIYGKILDNYNVVSSVQESSIIHTEKIWNRMYPDEPYSFDLKVVHMEDISKDLSDSEKYTKYDLVSAVKRQCPFFYQVSRPHVINDIFLKGAFARYKGFLHLIKRNRERSIKLFCVPTYDVDLMWHTHQLHPVAYCNDMNELIGKVLEHDDMDSDRTKGKKLDVGFTGTTKQWEDTFGTRYWKAGAMNRGNAPTPVTTTPFLSKIVSEKVTSMDSGKIIQLPDTKSIEVLLEVVGVRNLPEGHKGSLAVLVSKKEVDLFFDVKRRVHIFSESGAKHVTSFKCEPAGELFFELISHSPSKFLLHKQSKTLGSLSISLSDLLSPISKLSIEKWLELSPSPGYASLKPTSLRIAISVTVPTVAPSVVQMIRSKPFLKSSCFFSILGKSQNGRSWTRVIDVGGDEIVSLQMRDLKKEKARNSCILSKEVIGVMQSGETRTLAEFVESGWSLTDGDRSLQLKKKSSEDEDGHMFELMGPKMVKLYPGRKLEYEAKHCDKRKVEREFITAVEFSAENPYGKAVALLDFKFGLLKVSENWFLLPGILLSFILSDTLRKEGYELFTFNRENKKLEDNYNQKANVSCDDNEKNKPTSIVESDTQLKAVVASIGLMTPVMPSSCSGGCGSGCGNAVNSGGCGSGCGGGCGNAVNSGGCGGCGGGCGSGCGNMVKSGGCGGCGGGCGSGCGKKVKSGGCGSGCGGGCGNLLANERPNIIYPANEATMA